MTTPIIPGVNQPTSATSSAPPAATLQPTAPQTAIGIGTNAQNWAAAILTQLGAPINQANVASLVGWFANEDDHHTTAGQESNGIGGNNPLDITPDAGTFAGNVGTEPSGAGPGFPADINFSTPAAGVTASVQTMNKSYPAIVSALKSGKGLIGNSAVASELLEWSGNGYSSIAAPAGFVYGSPGAIGNAGSTATNAGSTLTSGQTITTSATSNPLFSFLGGIAGFTSIVPDLGNVTQGIVNGADALAALNHTLAVIIDYPLSMFKPGQAWRFVFTAMTLILAGFSWWVFGAPGGSVAGIQGSQGSQDGEGNTLPLAIILLGAALITGFMAFRPWPAPDNAAIKPGAYAYDLLSGHVPAAGPPAISPDEVHATEFALDMIAGIWAIQKISKSIDSISDAIDKAKDAALGWWGKLF